MRNRIISSIFVVLILLLFWTSTNKKAQVNSTEIILHDYFNTSISIKLYGNYTPADIEQIKELIKEELDPFNELVDRFNKYDTYGNLYDLNYNYEIPYNYNLADIIEASKYYYNNVSKQLNIALGPVTDIWKEATLNCNENNVCEVPTFDRLNAAFVNNDPNLIVVTKDKITIEPGMVIDLGAVAKGYGADLIASVLEGKGYNHYLINAGGNILGSMKNDVSSFTIGVTDPNNVSEQFIYLNIKNKAVVTSGDYENYFTVDGERYHHLINVDTLFPSKEFKSVTVITDGSFIADCYSTMLFGMSLEEGMGVVNSTEDLEAIWVLGDGSIEKSNGAAEYE